MGYKFYVALFGPKVLSQSWFLGLGVRLKTLIGRSRPHLILSVPLRKQVGKKLEEGTNKSENSTIQFHNSRDLMELDGKTLAYREIAIPDVRKKFSKCRTCQK